MAFKLHFYIPDRNAIGRSEKEMNITESPAMTNSSSILGNLHVAIPLGVMGILLVMVLPVSILILGLLITLNFALSIVSMLVSRSSGSRRISQYSHHSSFTVHLDTRNYL